MVNKTQLVKNVTSFVITAAVTSVVSNIAKAHVPVDAGRIVKIYNLIGTAAIGNAVGDLVAKKTSDQIDQIVGVKTQFDEAVAAAKAEQDALPMPGVDVTDSDDVPETNTKE